MSTRDPTEPLSCRGTESTRRALERRAEQLGIKRSDLQRTITVQALRLLGETVHDARVDKLLDTESARDVLGALGA
jgi:hypothetical protein